MSKQLLQGINTLLAESKRGGYAGCLLRCSTVCMQMFVIKSLLDGVRTQRGKRKGIMFFFFKLKYYRGGENNQKRIKRDKNE